MIKTITLTQFCEPPTTVPKTYYVIVDKIDVIEELPQGQGAFVTVNGLDIKVIEPADYILKKLQSMENFND